jgi:hypothetical protein
MNFHADNGLVGHRQLSSLKPRSKFVQSP